MLAPRSWGRRPLVFGTLLACLIVGCGGGGGGGPAAVVPQAPTALQGLSGVWQLSTTVTSNTCGLADGSTFIEPITLVQHEGAVSVITSSGLWGAGAVEGDSIEIDGSNIETEASGCTSSQRTTGSVSGSRTELGGSLTVTVSYDAASCGGRADCTISQRADLVLSEPYRSSCLERDAFGPSAESDYVLPFPLDAAYRLSNSYCWPAGGHREQLAYDFDMPIGDPIVAARAGVVREAKHDSPDDGQGSDHNHILVEHEDGSVAFYAHLQQDSARVQPGNTVQAGQHIANNGHSGTTDIPHLHFGVYRGYPPMEGADHAVNFRNAAGPLDCRGGLVMEETYLALVD